MKKDPAERGGQRNAQSLHSAVGSVELLGLDRLTDSNRQDWKVTR